MKNISTSDNMKAIVFDIKENYKTTLKNVWIKDNILYRKKGFFDKDGEALCSIDYSKIYNMGKDRVVFLRYDGKSYTQLFFDGDNNTNVNLKDYIREFKIAHLTANSMLQKPAELKEVLEWLMLIMIGLLAIISYFTAHTSYQIAQTNFKALNTSIASQNLQTKTLIYILERAYNITNLNYTQISKIKT